MSTTIDSNQNVLLDGPALHKAQGAIQQLRAEKELFAIAGLSRSMKALVDPIVSLLWASTANWNANRLEVLISLLDGQKEKALANKLNLSERSIYKTIKDGHLRHWVELIREVESRITQTLH